APRSAGGSAPGRGPASSLAASPVVPATVSIISRASFAIAFAVKSPPAVVRSPRTNGPFIPAMNARPVPPSMSRVSSAEVPVASPSASASRSPCALTARASSVPRRPVPRNAILMPPASHRRQDEEERWDSPSTARCRAPSPSMHNGGMTPRVTRRRALAAAAAAGFGLPAVAEAAPKPSRPRGRFQNLRVATYNVSLHRAEQGALLEDLATGEDPQIRAVAEVIQLNNPD